MMSLWDALRMNMMISYQELVRTFLSECFGCPQDASIFVTLWLLFFWVSLRLDNERQ